MTTTEECISAEDANSIIMALDNFINTQTEKGYKEDIKSMKIAKDALKFVLERSSPIHDDICFRVKIGTRNITDMTKFDIDNREKSKGQELLEYLESVRKPISHELDIPASDTRGPKFREEEKVPHTTEKGIRGMFRRGKIF